MLAQLQLVRQQNLTRDNATSKDALQIAEATQQSARAHLNAFKAQMRQTESTLRGDEANLGYTKIFAPMTGTVVSQTAKQGQTLNANQQAPIIMRIADLSTMTVQAQVSEADVPKLRVGMDVYFTTLGGDNRRFYGKLHQIPPTPTVVNNVVLYAATLLGACASTGNAPAPAPVMPQAYTEPGAYDAVVPLSDWWCAFGSWELASLVAAALDANPDLAIAAERVRQAEAQVGIAGATLFPALNLGADSAHRETRVDGGEWQAGNASGATLSASYELDVWGKNSAGVRSSEAALRASRFNRESVRLTLVAGVANAYFQVLSLRGRLEVAHENLIVAERVFAVVDSRVRNGAASALDLARQQAAVLTQRAAIPPLELQERQTRYALAILLGRAPEEFATAGLTLSGLFVPHVAPGLPSQLLVRRPDLASAEAQLAAAHANVAVARAALLPNIKLTGSAGLASDMLLNILHSPTATLAIGASLLQPIFDGGRLRAQIDVAASRERELVENYRKTVLVALADVESALAAEGRTAVQEQLQEMVVEQAREAFRLAEIRYREGVDDLLTTLDAQRTLFQAEDQLAQIRLTQLQASVSLFKALGGAWEL